MIKIQNYRTINLTAVFSFFFSSNILSGIIRINIKSQIPKNFNIHLSIKPSNMATPLLKDTVRSLSVVSNNPDYLQNYEKKFKTKKIS